MPLFFFLSGIFFNPQKTFKITCMEKCDSLLKPYFVTLLPIGIALATFSNEDLGVYSLKMLYGNGSTIRWTPLWFLPHLFAVILFSWGLTNLLNTNQAPRAVKAGLLAVLFLVGVGTISSFWGIDFLIFGNMHVLPGLPFSSDVVLVTTFYFLLGHFSSARVRTFKPTVPMFGLVVLLFAVCHYFFDQTIDLNLRRFDGFIIPTIESLCGIYLVLALSYCAQLNTASSRGLSVLGVSSLFTLIFHSFIQIRAYGLALRYFGEGSTLAVLFAFFVGSFTPVLIWYGIRKSDILALFYMPIKSNKMLHRDR